LNHELYGKIAFYDPQLADKRFGSSLFPCAEVLPRLASPLGWAAVLGLDTAARWLLDNNQADVNEYQDEALGKYNRRSTSVEGGPALMKAVCSGHASMVRLLIEKGAHVNFNPDLIKYDAVFMACVQRRVDIIGILLDNGTDPNGSQEHHRKPILHAADEGDRKICKLLLKRGADPDGPPSPRQTPLMGFSGYGELDMCKLLVNYGADINRRSDRPYFTNALACAAANGQVAVAQYLLDKHAIVSDDALYFSLGIVGSGPFDEHRIICQLLVEHGADLNPSWNDIFDQPLAIAMYNGWEDIVSLMVAKGAKIDPCDQTCRTSGNLLHAAVKSGKIELVEFLLDKGIDVNAPAAAVWRTLEDYEFVEPREPPISFTTPLEVAAYYLNVDMTRLLLERGADITSPGPSCENAFGAITQPLKSLSFRLKLGDQQLDNQGIIKLVQRVKDASAIFRLLPDTFSVNHQSYDNLEKRKALAVARDKCCEDLQTVMRRGIDKLERRL
jgi:ankyrin repeat domain-containing protein 50